jgi:hypothetical protein
MIRPRATIAQLMAVIFVVGTGTAVLRNNDRERRDGGTTCIESGRCDRPVAYVTDVDSALGAVRIDLPHGYGARLGMRMATFEPRSPGISIDEPKVIIELIKIGEHFSTARIVKSIRPTEPIRVGDAVYSPAWSPNQPMRFALMGKIDVNHDGRDDRNEVKRLIKEAGGLIDFDLPPPGVGKETGMLSPRMDWYVFDVPAPSPQADLPKSGLSPSPPAAFEQRKSQVIKEARLNGIRPMPLARLLTLLGYDGIGPRSLGRTDLRFIRLSAEGRIGRIRQRARRGIASARRSYARACSSGPRACLSSAYHPASSSSTVITVIARSSGGCASSFDMTAASPC